MKTEVEKIQILWRHAEGKCSVEEQTLLNQWLADDAELNTQWQEIQTLNNALQTDLSTDEPSMRFKTKVLEEFDVRRTEAVLVSDRLKVILVLGFVIASVLGAWLPKIYFDFNWLENVNMKIDWNWVSAFAIDEPTLTVDISPYWGVLLTVLLIFAVDRLMASRIRQ